MATIDLEAHFYTKAIMVYAGVFDQFPKLTIILGHMGESILF